MDKLNEYLQQLVSKCGYELHLEPNKQPYVVTTNGNAEISNSPLPGAQINMMVFSLIPHEVKQQLPNNTQVEFVHPHNLGDFNFLVRKSPAGFNVTISPSDSTSQALQSTASESVEMQEAYSPSSAQSNGNLDVVSSQNEEETELVIELNSPPQKKNDFVPQEKPTEEVLSTSEFEIEYLEDSKTLENHSENFSNSEVYSTPYEPVELEPSVSDPERFNYEQEEMAPEYNSFTENFATEQNFAENSTPQYQTEFSAPINNMSEPIVENYPVQTQTSYTPEVVEYSAPQTPPQTFVEPAKVSVPVAANPQAKAKMDALFHKMAGMGASDLHMSVSVSPMVRKDGKMVKLDATMPNLSPEAMKELLQSIMPPKNIEEFAERNDTDFAYEIKGLARFRANIFMDRKGMGGVFRIIPSEILTAEKLGLSKAIMDLCELSKGLVVVTGPTGSGKSTTLCAMVDSINKSREDHIITIEDPIEFTHENQMCLVNQREVHNHTDSFKDALRAALREDPDILLVGEMRDLETISIAIETAETGHLVFGTLHTTTAASTVDRIIDQFPADRQQQVRVMLSESLRGVIAQTLLPKIGGGRIAALEVLIVTPAVSNLIREGKTFQIPSAMQTGKNKGMVMLNDALMELVNKGLVTPRDAYIKAVDKTGFEMLLQRVGKSM